MANEASIRRYVEIGVASYFEYIPDDRDDEIFLSISGEATNERLFDILSEIDTTVINEVARLNSIPVDTNSYAELESKLQEAIDSNSKSFTVVLRGQTHEFKVYEGKYLIQMLQRRSIIDGVISVEAIYGKVAAANPALAPREVAFMAMKKCLEIKEKSIKPYEDAITSLQYHRMDMVQVQQDFGRNEQCIEEIKAIDIVLPILEAKQKEKLDQPDFPF